MTDDTKRRIAAKDARYARLWGLPGPGAAETPKPAKRGVCAHLGAKIDGPRQAACRCRYECEAGAAEYAVPGGNCQTCPKWEAD
jgi:hypothetical protein